MARFKDDGFSGFKEITRDGFGDLIAAIEALKALEQHDAERYWAAHETRHPSRPGDDLPDGKVYESMDALLADLGAGE